MSDIYGIITGAKTIQKQVCRVAYTLNNTQPVRCTIIDDQPLFYMDYDVDYEDENLDVLDYGDMGILEDELRSLKKEIETFDKFSEEFTQSPEQRFQEFLDDKDFITSPAEDNRKSNIQALLEVLANSRIAQAYVDYAQDHNVTLKYSAQVNDAHYDRVSGLILVNPNLDFTDQVLLSARELRRHWQHRQGALINPLMFHPDNAVLINRAQVADLSVSMVRIAWELQLSGMKECWERIENSSMADLGRALAREAFLDFRTLNNGQASTAVFESWFLSERCRQEDKKLIQQMLADYKGYVFDLDEAEANITPALIAALGTMPYGKNYLAQHAVTIMEDPIFTDIRDRSNANFLWFIKFERSFRETEQELQTSPERSTGDARSPIAQQHQDQEDGDHEIADIVSLYENEGDNPADSSRILPPISENERIKRGDSADIIYLRRWSGE